MKVSKKTPKRDLQSIGNETIQAIQGRAYELWLQRGRQDGNDLEDWLSAEREVLAEIKQSKA